MLREMVLAGEVRKGCKRILTARHIHRRPLSIIVLTY